MGRPYYGPYSFGLGACFASWQIYCSYQICSFKRLDLIKLYVKGSSKHQPNERTELVLAEEVFPGVPVNARVILVEQPGPAAPLGVFDIHDEKAFRDRSEACEHCEQFLLRSGMMETVLEDDHVELHLEGYLGYIVVRKKDIKVSSSGSGTERS